MCKTKEFSLEGVDGNVFCIISYVRDAMRECGCSNDEIKKFTEKCTSQHDYYSVIFLAQSKLDELNSHEA